MIGIWGASDLGWLKGACDIFWHGIHKHWHSFLLNYILKLLLLGSTVKTSFNHNFFPNYFGALHLLCNLTCCNLKGMLKNRIVAGTDWERILTVDLD